MYEVEQKFPVDDLSAVAAQLAALGAVAREPVTQIDTYYAHPVRDFSRTDEALRIRQIGENNRLTYKGPKLDAATKTRREIELPFASGNSTAAELDALLRELGFRPVRQVTKQRRPLTLRWQDRQIEVALDEVEGLGSFVELEIAAGEEELDTARSTIVALARHLNLPPDERRSYLELLLERQ